VKDIKESDWKHLRQLKPVLLDRFCSRVLSDIGRASLEAATGTSHERYLQVFSLVQDADKDLSQMFDDLKRSNAVGKLFLMRRAGLFAEDEWAGFSEEMKDVYARSQSL
jgi:hypothetical protein